MSEMAAREMTPQEWAERLTGASVDEIAMALGVAEARGKAKGRQSLEGAVSHFETAYRYAVNANRPGADAKDLLASAETFAKIAYDEWFKDVRNLPKPLPI